ncbi:hypothetical protein ACSBOB_32895 [Mesorhizobium sp. ASY16-5R]|uniref:hypothetical protein n=1 Tax=Mesorhizobium sp. ASY16-5R TaxID=3445772 RepID=UPI003F9F4CB0
MPQMHFPKILAFVEGHMERMFLNNNFKYVTVIPVSNGVSWTLAAMAKQILTLYRAKNAYPDHIIIWIDREGRKEAAEEISSFLRDRLVEAGADANKIHTLVPDLMTENLILSDEALMREYLANPDYAYNFEGAHGKSILKALINMAGKNYGETSTGVDLLKKIRISDSVLVSAAASRFLKTFQMECWWLQSRFA